MLQKNTLITIAVSSVISAFTAVSSVQLLFALSGESRSPDNNFVVNNVPLKDEVEEQVQELTLYDDLTTLARRITELEAQVQQQMADLSLVVNSAQAPRSEKEKTQQADHLNDDHPMLDEDQLMLQDQQAQLDFEDKNILFELEDYNKNSSSQLELALDDLATRSAGFGLEELEIYEQECRGQSCRVQFTFSGDESALQFLPVLLANKGHDSIQISQKASEQGVSIVALMR